GLIAEVSYTPNQHIQLIAASTTSSDHLLKSGTQLETTIRKLPPSATGLQKEVHLVQIVIHNIPTTLPSTEAGFNQVHREVEQFNPGITLHRSPRWLTKESQREGKQASSTVLSIAGRPQSTQALKASSTLGESSNAPHTSTSMHRPNAPPASATAITASAAPPHPPALYAQDPKPPTSTHAAALSANRRAHPVYTTRCSAATEDPPPIRATPLNAPPTSKPLLLPLLGKLDEEEEASYRLAVK
ncbi:hypothetical protein Q9L58_010755, partial [Maublancomyces gigas]